MLNLVGNPNDIFFEITLINIGRIAFLEEKSKISVSKSNCIFGYWEYPIRMELKSFAYRFPQLALIAQLTCTCNI